MQEKMGFYCGCGTRGNVVRWVIVAVLSVLGAGLFVGWITMSNACTFIENDSYNDHDDGAPLSRCANTVSESHERTGRCAAPRPQLLLAPKVNEPGVGVQRLGIATWDSSISASSVGSCPLWVPPSLVTSCAAASGRRRHQR
jgi:hypothetical protein